MADAYTLSIQNGCEAIGRMPRPRLSTILSHASVKPLVVVSALCDLQAVFGRAIHQTVFLGQPPRPPTAERAAQRLGLARPLKRRPRSFLDQRVETRQQFGIVALPIEVIFPRPLAEDEIHSISDCVSPWPSSSSAIDSSRRSALRGFFSRNRVSS